VNKIILKNLKERFYLFNHAINLCKLGSEGNILNFIKLTVLLFISGFSETLPIIALIPFITVISNPNKLFELRYIYEFSEKLNIKDPNELILPLFALFIIVIIINSSLRILTISFNNRLKASLGHQLSKKAYKKVIFSTYEYYIKTNSSKIITNFNEAIRRSVESIASFLEGIISFFNLTFLVFTLLFINKEITCILFIFTSLSYIFIGKIQTKTLKKEGRILSIGKEKQVNIIQETLGSKKEITLKNIYNLLIERFSNVNLKTELAIANINTASQLPKLFIEGFFIILLGSIVFIIKTTYDVDPLPIVGSISLGIQRILPATFGLFSAYAGLNARYDTSMNLVYMINNTPQEINSIGTNQEESTTFKNLILKNIYYSFPGEKRSTIKNISLEINKGEKIGIVGTTGSGKSTLIDLIMGFLTPKEGNILVNGQSISKKENIDELLKWRNSITLVPQNIYLKDSTIVENIAYGEGIDRIDFEKALDCCRSSKIYDFIMSTEKGLYTMVGERGINLSGGQIQRLAIARALYKDAQVLILDEATSALDSKTEKEVVNALRKFKKEITIISISHRINTISGYDRIIKIDNGKIISSNIN
tara:strand:+ start:208 stop:1992 length:1785 start_codon:yes stop_codon:yes gene_type:complete